MESTKSFLANGTQVLLPPRRPGQADAPDGDLDAGVRVIRVVRVVPGPALPTAQARPLDALLDNVDDALPQRGVPPQREIIPAQADGRRDAHLPVAAAVEVPVRLAVVGRERLEGRRTGQRSGHGGDDLGCRAGKVLRGEAEAAHAGLGVEGRAAVREGAVLVGRSCEGAQSCEAGEIGETVRGRGFESIIIL